MAKPTEIVYSSTATEHAAGREFCNPRFFNGVPPGTTKAVVVGTWPRIVAAYKAAGVPVEVVGGNPQGKPADRPVPAKPAVPEVDIPKDWRRLGWQRKRSLASKLSDVPVINRAEAEAVIDAEIARRSA